MIRFYTEDQANYVETLSPAVGESHEWVPGQSSRESYSGYLSVHDRGFINRAIAFVIEELTQQQMVDLRIFFLTTLGFALEAFYLRKPNPRTASAWGQVLIPIYAGATVASATILTGTTYTAGQEIAADYEWIGPCRLRMGGFKVSTIPAKNGNVYNAAISASVEHES